jgi:hypothetical protein
MCKVELLQTAEYAIANAKLKAFTLAQGLRFLDEPAKHGPSPAEYRRDENCVRIAPDMRGCERFWVLLHELGHHLSGASDQEWIEGDLGVTEAIADLIAIRVLTVLGAPTAGPEVHLEAVKLMFPSTEGVEMRHAALIEASAQQLLEALQ